MNESEGMAQGEGKKKFYFGEESDNDDSDEKNREVSNEDYSDEYDTDDGDDPKVFLPSGEFFNPGIGLE